MLNSLFGFIVVLLQLDKRKDQAKHLFFAAFDLGYNLKVWEYNWKKSGKVMEFHAGFLCENSCMQVYIITLPCIYNF